jgi:hypothetical protein
MNHEADLGGMTEHQEIASLFPWYVNDTIDLPQRQRVEAHLEGCAVCRADLQVERRIHESMAVGPGVEYMPAPSLKRLRTRLDAAAVATADGGTQGAEDLRGKRLPVTPARQVHLKSRRQLLMVASVAAIAVTLGVFRWDHAPPAPSHGNFHTVTSPAPRVPDEVIRAVFAPSITLHDLQALLDESGLRIVAGPTEAGVYSLAAGSSRPVSTSLESLRKHSTVRFAESTLPSAAPIERP